MAINSIIVLDKLSNTGLKKGELILPFNYSSLRGVSKINLDLQQLTNLSNSGNTPNVLLVAVEEDFKKIKKRIKNVKS